MENKGVNAWFKLQIWEVWGELRRQGACLHRDIIVVPFWYHFIDFSDLENLVELDLSLNFLSSVPVRALGQLRNLKFLNLGSNRIQVWQFLWLLITFSKPKEMMRNQLVQLKSESMF